MGFMLRHVHLVHECMCAHGTHADVVCGHACDTACKYAWHINDNLITSILYIYILYIIYIYIYVTPADQMSDKSGFEICRECRLKPVGMIWMNFRFLHK